MENNISIQTLQRLPIYLSLLKNKAKNRTENISAKMIADELGLGEIQVRKDLASVSKGGKPKIGYIITDLITDIEYALGYDDVNDAILVGAGNLGKALMSYKGFNDYGLNIIAAFDTNPTLFGNNNNGKPIFAVDKIKDICERLKIRIGIITVPAEYAQSVCDTLVDSGIIAIWNFAPTHLRAPDNIFIKSENMAASLAVLSNHLKEKLIF
ncbi:MAG: redox-sensing transcriptional repressor Rex [Clostridia bacterium]